MERVFYRLYFVVWRTGCIQICEQSGVPDYDLQLAGYSTQAVVAGCPKDKNWNILSESIDTFWNFNCNFWIIEIKKEIISDPIF